MPLLSLLLIGAEKRKRAASRKTVRSRKAAHKPRSRRAASRSPRRAWPG